jgi:hypothetical protein
MKKDIQKPLLIININNHQIEWIGLSFQPVIAIITAQINMNKILLPTIH